MQELALQQRVAECCSSIQPLISSRKREARLSPAAAALAQGFGTFESPDGSRYQGGWQANLKHGLGKKVYANGDRWGWADRWQGWKAAAWASGAAGLRCHRAPCGAPALPPPRQL